LSFYDVMREINGCSIRVVDGISNHDTPVIEPRSGAAAADESVLGAGRPTVGAALVGLYVLVALVGLVWTPAPPGLQRVAGRAPQV
jgi:hypothetical protein